MNIRFVRAPGPRTVPDARVRGLLLDREGGDVAGVVFCKFTDGEGARDLFPLVSDAIAAVIVGLIRHGAGRLPPASELRRTLRSCCDRYRSLPVFADVAVGFRHGFGSREADARRAPRPVRVRPRYRERNWALVPFIRTTVDGQ